MPDKVTQKVDIDETCEPFFASESDVNYLEPCIEVTEDNMDLEHQRCLKGQANIGDHEGEYLEKHDVIITDYDGFERKNIFDRGLSNVDTFPIWKKTMKIDPTPTVVYFCKGQITDRETIHAADGLSWSSCGRTKGIYSERLCSLYYVAIPDTFKMTDEQKECFCTADKGKEIETLKILNSDITFRKTITYSEKGLFMIDYVGDHTVLPWKKRSQYNSRLKKAVTSYEVKNKVAITTKLIEERMQREILSTQQVKGVTKGNDFQRKPTFKEALLFMQCNESSKYCNKKDINDLLCNNIEQMHHLNDARVTQISVPRAGDCYLMDLSNIKRWKGAFHCDGLSWRSKGTSNGRDFSFISEDYIFMKKSKPFPAFKKTTHYNSQTKLMFIQYYGNEEASLARAIHGNRKHGKNVHVPSSTFVKVNLRGIIVVGN